MTTEHDLRATLASHTVTTPDVAAIRDGIDRGVRRRRRQRRTATGVGVLAVMVLPAVSLQLAGHATDTAPHAQVADAPSTPPVQVDARCTTRDPSVLGTNSVSSAIEVFHDAGYTDADATQIAAAWANGPLTAAAVAGQRIHDGQPVPIRASGPAQSGSPTVRVEGGAGMQEQSPGTNGPVDAFLGAGCTYEDALWIASQWNEDLTAVKAVIGQDIMDNGPSKP